MRISLSIRLPRKRKATRSFSTALPLEIQHLVLDDIACAGDVQELCRLCTICRAWADHAQTLIFQDVWVTETDVQRLLSLFKAKPRLGRCVTTLRVVGDEIRSYTSYTPTRATENTTTVLEQLVQHLPDLMQNVRTLHFVTPGNNGAPVHNPSSCVSTLSRITRLRICCRRDTTANYVLRFIALFPGLQSLEFSGYPGRLTGTTPFLPPALINLNRLVLPAAFCSGPIMRWLSNGWLSVIDLTIESWCQERGPVHSLLISTAGTLHYLRLQVGSIAPPAFPRITLPLFLPSCCSLRNLDVSLRFSLSTENRKYMELGLLSVLRQLSAPHLFRVYVETHFTRSLQPEGVAAELPWDEVDATLQAFDGLRLAVFDFYAMFDLYGGDRDALCRDVRRKMPLSDSRGILIINCAGAPRQENRSC
ncbi:hypothetical protein B0H19DRAFT_144696 [Mycena capillaripes]|nr:hypothetical protein B0H19DRAFT_144696 [Mycena capillaripes]